MRTWGGIERPAPEYVDLFWSKVEKQEGDGCWLWSGRTSGHGYGRAQVAPRKTALAHRVAYAIEHGAIEPNVCVLHHCDTRLCVRPAHLFSGDRGDNARDMAAKGRAHLQVNPRAFAGESPLEAPAPRAYPQEAATPLRELRRAHDRRSPRSLYQLRPILPPPRRRTARTPVHESEEGLMSATLRSIPIAELKDHPENPRKHFDAVALADLTDSVKTKGVLNPLLVRPNGKGFEILAGARRFRAAHLAGLQEVPALVREMDDTAALEVVIIDNLQRDDLHPLEEAQGFADLMKRASYDVDTIAQRIGRSSKYVYDRIKLLQLVPELREVFLAGEITAGHAILLARLDAEAQQRCLGSNDGSYGRIGGLFETDRGVDDHQLEATLEAIEDSDEYDAEYDRRTRKAVSVRELQKYIDDHVRFRPEAEDLPNLFPETALALETAEAAELKVVHITRDYQLRPETREGRTYSCQSWKRADGEREYSGFDDEPSKECEHRVMGVVVAGAGRGEAFYVCIAKKKCEVHWKAEQEAANQRGAPNGAGTKAGRDSYAEAQRKRQERWKREQEEQARWKKAAPKLLEALAEKLAETPALELVDDVIKKCKPYGFSSKVMDQGETLEDAVRYAAFLVIATDVIDNWRAPVNAPKALNRFGINAKKLVDEVAPKPKPEKKPKAATSKNAKKKAAKAAAKKGGARARRREKKEATADVSTEASS